MLYLDCQHDPVCLTEHLRGTRECEQKVDGHNLDLDARMPGVPGKCSLASQTLRVCSHFRHHNMFAAHSIVHFRRSMSDLVSFVLMVPGWRGEACLAVKHWDR